MKKRSRVLTAVIAVCMIAAMMPIASFAAQTTTAAGYSRALFRRYQRCRG